MIFTTYAKKHQKLICGSRFAVWVVLCSVCLLLPCGIAAAAGQNGPKQVLILYSYGRNFSPYNTIASTFETELAQQSRIPIEFHEVSLEGEMFTGSKYDERTIRYIQTLFSDCQPDLIVPVGGPAVRFMLRLRPKLFPSAPVLLAGCEARYLKTFTLDTNTVAVPSQFDFPDLMEHLLRILPGTTNVAVVLGSSGPERFRKKELQQDLAGFTNRFALSWLDQYSLEEMREQVRHLPPHSVIFYVSLFVDAAGVPHEYDEAIKALHAGANAPMAGLFEEELGLGIVGGPLLNLHEQGHETAQVAMRILSGETPGNIQPTAATTGIPVYDWRELRRWGISGDRLPPGSIVRYKLPTVWERHKNLIVAIVSLVLVQSLLIAGMMVNLNRRRKAERALRESERRFRAVADSAPVFIWKSGRDEMRVFFNRGWLEFTGRSMERELGYGWTEGVHPEDLERCGKIYRASFAAREPFEVEYRLRRHDGEYRWVLDRGVPRRTADGEFMGYVGVAIDLTERKRAEEARQKLFHISRLVLVGELTAMIAHELNQPLNATQLNLDVLKTLLNMGSVPVEEVRNILGEIRADNLRASEAIRRIRALVSRHEMEMHTLDMNAMVLEVAKLVKADVMRRGVQLHVACNAPFALVRGDSVHLQQVLLNLMLNGMDAVKNNAVSERHVFVSTLANVDGYIEIAVKDTGDGIEPENLSRIFDSFFTTKPDGMGIGLSMANSIVQLHSGRLWAENNKDGRGTTLRFILPVLVSEAAKPLPLKESKA
jgi:PAS domain S-box-containing protein